MGTQRRRNGTCKIRNCSHRTTGLCASYDRSPASYPIRNQNAELLAPNIAAQKSPCEKLKQCSAAESAVESMPCNSPLLTSQGLLYPQCGNRVHRKCPLGWEYRRNHSDKDTDRDNRRNGLPVQRGDSLRQQERQWLGQRDGYGKAGEESGTDCQDGGTQHRGQHLGRRGSECHSEPDLCRAA
jgi:hypothetical protein